MLLVVLFIITKIWKQPKHPSIDDSMKKWCVYTMKYYQAIRKNEVAPFATAQINLGGIMLSEISQTEKGK